MRVMDINNTLISHTHLDKVAFPRENVWWLGTTSLSSLGGEPVANSIRKEKKSSSPEKGAPILHILPITICTEGVFLLNTE